MISTLVRQSLAGQTEAFGVLVTRYQKVMYTVALRMLGNAEDARDATQDAFVKAYQHLSTFDSRYRFYSWMYRILMNECLNVNRDRRFQEPLDPDAAGAGSPFDTALAAERSVQINMALEQLRRNTAPWWCFGISPGSRPAKSPRHCRFRRRP